METIIQELVAFVQKAAPVMWEAAYRQVYVNALYSLGWALIWSIVGVVSYKVAKHSLRVVATRRSENENKDWSYSKEEPWDTDTFLGVYLGYAAALFSLICVIVNAFTIVGYFINPSYYAIQNLIKLFPGQ